MTWVVPLVLVGVAVLIMVVFTILSARRVHRRTVAPATMARPSILVHDINDDRCTGCDACVAVCPTNVLDLVANKSRVLRFEDCIQCEACMYACPTEALVMFPEGTTPPPLKVPAIDDNFQTVVPGQYLIGEVAGKPLVKNAANLGRAVIEHMMSSGLRAGAIGNSDTIVDVAIVGSGPGGLSAALTCIQRGLSYVVLEKEHLIASTIARYPKGKLVMAEPYDTVNLSLLPVFDASKEQLIPIWQDLFERIGLNVRLGESVETVTRTPHGLFEINTTVSVYRAQRLVLSIGTRGKPRTLQVPGENLPKVVNLLQDPDEWRERWVLVVGGGDSACEAALALADAGAKVLISYRGKSFNRAAPRNKQSIEAYAAEGRIKAALGSQVLAFDHDAVTLALGDGSQQRLRNEAAFVLIGADPPISWLEKLGILFVERPHGHQLGKTDDIVRRHVARAIECPEDAARAAAQVLGGEVALAPAPVASAQMPTIAMPISAPASGPRKWLQSATSLFSLKPNHAPKIAPDKLDPPVALPGLPKRKTFGPASPGTGLHHTHSGHGRRDQLSVNERARLLRMLRDVGGSEGDEPDDQVYIGAAPATARAPAGLPVLESQPQPPPRPRPQPPLRPSTDDDERVHIGAIPGVELGSRPRGASAPKFLDAPTHLSNTDLEALQQVAALDRASAHRSDHRWLAQAPITEPHVPDFDGGRDDGAVAGSSDLTEMDWERADDEPGR